MKKMIVALLATGLMGSALAQSADSQQPATPPAPAVAGAKTATTQSLGEMTPFYVIGGVVIAGAIVAASSGGNDHKTSTPPPTGTTGTN
ncbi:hypothetical protein ASD55_03830 [Rhodanobacter sp. Root561]|uniref:hypothetical protein n=1 Tax=Rhodanobacter sp. Root561 TaxID=1736560 RepID=UPI0006F63466|nr:hypothetical protein [Rhodanobacter sp. Root561]KQZ79822.1 hypothetical protein ASD55_03830 [Rhodanobacter sp. Root561]